MGMPPLQIIAVALGLVVVGWGIIRFSKAVTATVAETWFARREQHTRRILEMSKEDK